MSTPIIEPGGAIGVLGGGQLGRMFAIAARRMGYRVHTLSPDLDTPTGQVSDVEVRAAYDDLDAVAEFARKVQVVTFEFENVPAATAEECARHAPVRPAGVVLNTTQNRAREKRFLADNGFPVTRWAVIATEEDVDPACAAVGFPAVLKTAAWGYDGKGQARVSSKEAVLGAWQAHGEQQMVLEALVDFELELSVVAARSLDGSYADYGLIENHHQRHILDVSVAPARVPDSVRRRALQIARGVLETLDVVGVLCIELFLTRGGELLVNELAPRPHNSGHLTFDACVSSQFEQQLRAICGLPLGSMELLRPAAMANLLGELWDTGTPDWAAACRHPEIKLHLYGKARPHRGRKMGHLVAFGSDADTAERTVLAARAALVPSPR
ncbi:MAG: N5-carboxyaminoimidazole ribonucleotide synthase [Myxococcales bacterium]